MLHTGTSKLLVILALSLSGTLGGFIPSAQASSEIYQLTAFPFYSQEGSTITIVLHVGGAQNPANYSFTFNVRNPTGTVWSSSLQNATTGRGQTEFGIIVSFPGLEFPCIPSCPSTSFEGRYDVAVNQLLPCCRTNPVQTALFYVGILDRYLPYQRTETVQVLATGYGPGEIGRASCRERVYVLV